MTAPSPPDEFLPFAWYAIWHSPWLFAAVVVTVMSGLLIVAAAPSVRRGQDVMGVVLTALMLAMLGMVLGRVAVAVGLS